MNYLLEIKGEANQDIIEAYEYYESKSIGLGERFLEQIEIFLKLITQNPHLFPSKKSPFREAFILDFPYLIIYEISGNTVVVYAIFNTSQNPSKRPQLK